MSSHPFIPVPNAAAVELVYSYQGLLFENVLHVVKGSNYSLADLVAMRTIVDNWDSTSWKSQRSGAATLQRIRSRALDSASGALDEYQLPTPRAGTDGGAGMPAGVSFCLKFTTGLAGRSFRGRLYTGGMTLSMLAGGSQQVAAAYASACVTSLNLLKTNLNTGGHTLCIVSYRHLNAWRTTGVATAVTGVSYSDLNVDSQRRRLAGRGRT